MLTLYCRIYDTFIALDSPLELNIATRERVEKKFKSLQWSVITRDDALSMLRETEDEVLTMLVNIDNWNLSLLSLTRMHST